MYEFELYLIKLIAKCLDDSNPIVVNILLTFVFKYREYSQKSKDNYLDQDSYSDIRAPLNTYSPSPYRMMSLPKTPLSAQNIKIRSFCSDYNLFRYKINTKRNTFNCLFLDIRAALSKHILEVRLTTIVKFKVNKL